MSSAFAKAPSFVEIGPHSRSKPASFDVLAAQAIKLPQYNVNVDSVRGSHATILLLCLRLPDHSALFISTSIP